VCNKFRKRCILIPNLKIIVNYTILTPQYFLNSVLVQQFIFVIFNSWLREERERGRRISAVERKTCCWYKFRLPKQTIFMLNSFFWWEEFILGAFFTFKIREKIDLSSGWFSVRVDFGFWDGNLVFLRPWINLTWLLRCFRTSKWVEKKVFW